jgi:hypothetical protein
MRLAMLLTAAASEVSAGLCPGGRFLNSADHECEPCIPGCFCKDDKEEMCPPGKPPRADHPP